MLVIPVRQEICIHARCTADRAVEGLNAQANSDHSCAHCSQMSENYDIPLSPRFAEEIGEFANKAEELTWRFGIEDDLKEEDASFKRRLRLTLSSSPKRARDDPPGRGTQQCSVFHGPDGPQTQQIVVAGDERQIHNLSGRSEKSVSRVTVRQR